MGFFKFQRLFSTMYDRLPVSARRRISPVLEPSYFAVKRIFSIVSQLHLPVYQLQGKIRWGDGNLTTLLYGEGRGMLPYILNLVYADKPAKKKLGKVFMGKIRSHINLYSPNVDLALIGVDGFFSKFLSRQGFVVLPEWAMFKLDTTKPLPTGRRGRGLRENLKRAMQYEYYSEMTRDPTKFEYFYHHMYLPYADKKYRELSLVGGFHGLWKIFERGGLLLVNRGSECIAGYLLEMKDQIVSGRYVGVKDGNVKYVEEGALLACYYFTIAWAKEKGYKWVDFGHCRPFFNDGPFIHKKRWGMEIMKSTRLTFDGKAVFGMKACGHQQELRDFLTKNPFISIDKGKLKGLIFSQQDHPMTVEETEALFRTYYIPGIDNLVISSLQGFTQEAEDFASSQSPQRLYLTRLNPDAFFDSIRTSLLKDARRSYQ